MTVKYTVVARGNPQNPDAPKKHHVVAKSTGETTLPELAERMAEMSTLSSVDLAAAIEALLTVIPRELAAGNIVRLGDFGSFSLRVRSEGQRQRKESLPATSPSGSSPSAPASASPGWWMISNSNLCSEELSNSPEGTLQLSSGEL